MHLTTIALFLLTSQIRALVHPWVGEPSKQIPDPKQPNWWMTRHVGLLTQNVQHRANTQIVFIGDSITDGWSSIGKDVWNKYYAPRGAYNYGIAGDQTQNDSNTTQQKRFENKINLICH